MKLSSMHVARQAVHKHCVLQLLLTYTAAAYASMSTQRRPYLPASFIPARHISYAEGK